MSLKIQQSKITSLRSQISQGDGAAQGYNLSQYNSDVRDGGRTSCTWKDDATAKSKKGATAFMLHMDDGTVVVATP